MEESTQNRELALVLGGGGARSAYQAGVICCMRELAPEVSYPIISGVSAGAINAVYLAGNPGRAGAEALVQCWKKIHRNRVYKPESAMSVIRRILPTIPLANAVIQLQEGEAILDTKPLRKYLSQQLPTSLDGTLPQVHRNLSEGELSAVCVTTTSFTTGQSVTWVQGRELKGWQRPNRIAHQTEITLDHVMASSALPLLFPAVQIGSQWHGDGGIRLIAPLAPALHLGATDIICISPKYPRTQMEAAVPAITGYPPAAQIMGIMLNATFLDAFDHDVRMANRITRLARHTPEAERGGIRPVNILLIQPSRDVAKLAQGLEGKTRGILRMLTKGLGSADTLSPDWLSVMLFEPEFIERVLELGYEDGRRQASEIMKFLGRAMNE